MSIQVGTLEARNNLSHFVDLASKGEVVTITRHGIPVAKLVSANAADPHVRPPVDDWLALRTGNSLNPAKLRTRGLTTRQLIEEGRR